MDDGERHDGSQTPTAAGSSSGSPDKPAWWDARDAAAAGAVLRVPGYRVGRLLDSGAQGVVLEGIHLASGRHVALKILPRHASQGARERFRREIEALGSLEHPNVVTLFETGVVKDVPWFSMRLVDGPTIAAHVDARRLSVEQTLALFLGACEGVAHAHQRGVLHRDVKPDNIRVDGDGAPCVLDFGLARVGVDASLTDAGDILGTLGYAAPEQLEGDARKVDVRADVYGLGAVLHRLLTGSAPFDLPSGLGDALRVIRESEPTPPSLRRPGLARDIDAIILKALSKHPDGRYDSVEALSADVRRYLAGDAVQARAASRWYVAWKTVRRHRVAVVVGGAFVALALLSVAMIVARGAAMERQRDRAVLAEQDARTEAAKSKQVADFFADLIEQAGPRAGGIGAEAFAQLLGAADRKIRGEMEDRPDVQVVLLAVIGRAFLETDEPALAQAPLFRVLGIQERLHGSDHISVADACDDLANARLALGHADEALSLVERSLRIRRDRLGANHPAVADALLTMAEVHVAMGELDKARKAAEAGVAMRVTLLGDGSLDVVAARVVLGDILLKQQDVAGAIAMLRSAHDAYGVVGLRAMGSVPAAEAALALGRALAADGRLDDAEVLFHEAQERFEKGLGSRSRRVAGAAYELAAVLERGGEPRRAIDGLRQAVAIQRAMCGTDSREVLQTLELLVPLIAVHGDRKEAEALRAEAARMKMRLSLPGMP